MGTFVAVTLTVFIILTFELAVIPAIIVGFTCGLVGVSIDVARNS